MLLTRRMDFSASHCVRRADWDQARNLDAFGPRADQPSHGHNYVLEVSVGWKVDPQTGMVIDLKELKEVMESEIGRRFDHRDLNTDTDFFAHDAPTAENLVRVIFDLLEAALPNGLLQRVRLMPNRDCAVEVTR
ncbi:MAG: 6-carboxytetrahydropterin synthase [bacterium]|nr:6-carboxytetrahydropterin synthase [bacterium]